jgi:hypothetical protein
MYGGTGIWQRYHARGGFHQLAIQSVMYAPIFVRVRRSLSRRVDDSRSSSSIVSSQKHALSHPPHTLTVSPNDSPKSRVGKHWKPANALGGKVETLPSSSKSTGTGSRTGHQVVCLQHSLVSLPAAAPNIFNDEMYFPPSAQMASTVIWALGGAITECC